MRWMRSATGARLLLTIASLFGVSALATTTIVIEQDHAGTVREVQERNTVLAQVLEEHTRNSFDISKIALLDLEHMLKSSGKLEVTPPMASRMAAWIKDIPVVYSFWLIDAAGRAVYTTQPIDASRVNFSDREYFRAHANGKDFHVGRMTRGRIDNVWFFSLSKRLTGADGQFQGVLVASMKTEYFTSLYQRLGLGPNDNIALNRLDGAVVARRLATNWTGEVGPSDPKHPLFTEHLPKARSGIYEATSGIDGIRRLAAYRVVEGWPLVVLSASDKNAVLSAWRTRAWHNSLSCAAGLLFLGTLSWWGLRRIRGEALAQIELQKSNRRYSLLVASTFEGVAITEGGRIIDANDQLVEMLGYPREDLIGLSVEALIPTEDRVRVVSNIRNGVESRIEHGLILKDGSRIEIEAHGQNYEDGGRVFRLTSLRDITARKKAEAKERESLQMEHLRNLSIESTLSEERERRSIAKDLHDGLGQTLHLARFKLDTLIKSLMKDSPTSALAQELGNLLAEASQEVRTLTSQLSPPALKELGLVLALSWLADEMKRLHGLTVVLEDDGDPKPLTEAQASLLFRAVRELVVNVSKHAGVDTVRITLRSSLDRLSILVADEGVGISDWRSTIFSRESFGLASVHERIEFLGGAMDIQSHPRGGTTVILEIPLDPHAHPVEMKS